MKSNKDKIKLWHQGWGAVHTEMGFQEFVNIPSSTKVILSGIYRPINFGTLPDRPAVAIQASSSPILKPLPKWITALR